MTTTFTPGVQPAWPYMALASMVPAVSRVSSLGYATNVDTSIVPCDVWSGAVLRTINGIDHTKIQLPATATAMEIVSSSASDAAAGVGARTVQVSYLDASYTAQVTTLTLNGLTPVAGPTALRVNSIIVLTAGVSQNNVGNLSLRTVGGLGATWSYVLAGYGVSQTSCFSVPTGFTVDVLNVLTSVLQVDTTARQGVFSLCSQNSVGRRLKPLVFGCASSSNYLHHANGFPIISTPAQTDMWVRCENVNASNTAVTAAIIGIMR